MIRSDGAPKCVIVTQSYDAQKFRDCPAERTCEMVISPHPGRKTLN
mgnify:FL=1